MPTINEAKESILSRFKATWDVDHPGVPYEFDNESFDADEESGSDDAWVRLVVRHEDANQETLGKPQNRRFRRPARVMAQVFVKVDTGTQQADTLVDAVRNIFEGASFDGLHFNAVSSREIGVDGKWYQVNVEAPFFYQERK